jgi:hypothetical protein
MAKYKATLEQKIQSPTQVPGRNVHRCRIRRIQEPSEEPHNNTNNLYVSKQGGYAGKTKAWMKWNWHSKGLRITWRLQKSKTPTELFRWGVLAYEA